MFTIEIPADHAIGPMITEPIWTDRLFDEGVEYFTLKIKEGLKKFNESVVAIYGYSPPMWVIGGIRETVHPAITAIIRVS
ncbi:MAG: hypothetical protein IIA60_08000 [Candidatus Marinimicrobia bacterium]|nr:hypothetical protein [Candidatus Neomarinimicrobiota bacterium]